jgi:hypothetical protein
VLAVHNQIHLQADGNEPSQHRQDNDGDGGTTFSGNILVVCGLGAVAILLVGPQWRAFALYRRISEGHDAITAAFVVTHFLIVARGCRNKRLWFKKRTLAKHADAVMAYGLQHFTRLLTQRIRQPRKLLFRNDALGVLHRHIYNVSMAKTYARGQAPVQESKRVAHFFQRHHGACGALVEQHVREGHNRVRVWQRRVNVFRATLLVDCWAPVRVVRAGDTRHQRLEMNRLQPRATYADGFQVRQDKVSVAIADTSKAQILNMRIGQISVSLHMRMRLEHNSKCTML